MFERYRLARIAALPLPPLIVALLGWVTVTQASNVEWLRIIETASRGVLTPSFVISLIAIGVVIASAVMVGGIQLDDLGLDRDYLGRGGAVTAMIWGAAQVIGVLPRVVANRPVLLHRDFEHGSGWDMAGQFLTALGGASVEEIALRGFLLTQLYLRFTRDRRDPTAGEVGAVALTVLAGCLAVLPATLPYPSLEVAAVHQATCLGIGVFLCWLYLRTRNIFFAIGVHALLIAPSPIVAGPRGGGSWFHPLVIGVLAGLWALLWPKRD
jgi:uncharacterized protein